MKVTRYLSVLAALALALLSSPSYSQTPDCDSLRGIYKRYNAPSVVQDTPAPKGYAPVYISHYSRHGSRYHSAPSFVSVSRDSLKAAQGRGTLTPLGERTLAFLDHLWNESDGCWGELTDIGAQEHKDIIRRMVKRFTPVFKGERRVDAFSSTRTRCIISMNAGVSTLSAAAPKLQFSFYCGEKYNRLVRNETHLKDAQAWYNPRLDSALVAARDWGECIGRFYTDCRADALGKMMIARSLWYSWADAPCLGLNGDEILEGFMPEELWDMARWVDMNICMKCLRTDRFQEQRILSQTPLLQDIIRRADATLSDGKSAATLRYGHDANLVPLLGLMKVKGFERTYVLSDRPDSHWNNARMMCMASNLQLVFYRHPKKTAVLVKILFNEKEMSVCGLDAVHGPYYDWAALKRFWRLQSRITQEPSPLRVGTYNLRMQHLDKGDNHWSLRRSRVMRSIRDNAFDVFGVQELTEGAEENLLQDLGDTYAAVFFSPYSQDGKGGKAQGILYNRHRFELVDSHYFWMSDTPELMSDNDHHNYPKRPNFSYKRGSVCATFKEKSTGRRFFVINTHAALNKEEHLRFAPVYEAMEARYNPDGLPSFFVGDFNARRDHPSHQIFRRRWQDAADLAPVRTNTFNGFKTDSTQWEAVKHIDYIYYRNVDAPIRYVCNQTLYDGFCASDHFPVWADFELSALPEEKTMDLRSLGVDAGGETLVTGQIQQAIDELSAAGGGRILLSGGTFLTAPIELKNGVDLHIDAGATLLGSAVLSDYKDRPSPRHVETDALPRKRNIALIYADEAEDFAITGKGTIDCNGEHYVKAKTGENWKGWHFDRIVSMEESIPRAAFFAGCRNLCIRDITMTNQPAGWSYWVHDCDYVRFKDCQILADVRYPNNDGIHVNSSRDVFISGCLIETGDDSIVMRANNRSLRENKVCERVVATDCRLRSWSAGIRIGWCNDGVIRDCAASHLTIYDSSNGIGCYVPLKKYATNDYGREATRVENLYFTDIRMDEIYGNPIFFKIADDPEIQFAGVHDIRFNQVHCRALAAPYIAGRADAWTTDIHFKNCVFEVCPASDFPGDARRHGYVLNTDPAQAAHTRNINFD